MSAVTVGIVGAVINGVTGSDLFATIGGVGAGLGVLTGGYAMVRWSVQRQITRRYQQVRTVLARLEAIVHDRSPGARPDGRSMPGSTS